MQEFESRQIRHLRLDAGWNQRYIQIRDRAVYIGLYTGESSTMTISRKPHLTGLLLATLLLNGWGAAQIQAPPQPQTNSSSTSATQAVRQAQLNCQHNGAYVNSQGQSVKRPEYCSAAPEGATAQCRDGSYSFSTHRRGTCSHHGGVAKWL